VNVAHDPQRVLSPVFFFFLFFFCFFFVFFFFFFFFFIFFFFFFFCFFFFLFFFVFFYHVFLDMEGILFFPFLFFLRRSLVIADLQAQLFVAVQDTDLAQAKRLNDRIHPTARVVLCRPGPQHNRMKEALVLSRAVLPRRWCCRLW